MRRILVIDDNESAAVILAKLLDHSGYCAAFALTGEVALQTAAVFDPDVVFIDLIMPDMSGYEIAQKLRYQGTPGRPKIVSLTGMPRGKGHGDDSIFDEYLLKPADLATLRRVIDGPGARSRESA